MQHWALWSFISEKKSTHYLYAHTHWFIDLQQSLRLWLWVRTSALTRGIISRKNTMTAGTLWRNLKVRSQLPNVTWKTCLEKIQVYEAKMRNCLANYLRFLVRCCKGKTLKSTTGGPPLYSPAPLHAVSDYKERSYKERRWNFGKI